MKTLSTISTLCLLVLLTACNGSQPASEHEHEHDEEEENVVHFSHEQAEAAGLRTESVEPGLFAVTIRVSGQVTAAQGDEATLTARTSGILRFVREHLAEGTAVGNGEVLATITASAVSGGDANARDAAALRTARQAYERARALYADTLISRREYERISGEYEQARIAAAPGASSAQVSAPFSGYIKQILVREGEYVDVGQTIGTVTRNCNLQLRAEVPEKYFAQMHDIRSANFEMSYGGGVHSIDSLGGHLVSMGKVADEGSAYIPVTFEFPNSTTLVPGAFADIWLVGQQREGVISVPTAALIEEQGVYSVYVQGHDDHEYERREVSIGGCDGIRTEITAGLKRGDRVVTSGVRQLRLAAASGAIPEAHSHEH